MRFVASEGTCPVCPPAWMVIVFPLAQSAMLVQSAGASETGMDSLDSGGFSSELKPSA